MLILRGAGAGLPRLAFEQVIEGLLFVCDLMQQKDFHVDSALCQESVQKYLLIVEEQQEPGLRNLPVD